MGDQKQSDEKTVPGNGDRDATGAFAPGDETVDAPPSAVKHSPPTPVKETVNFVPSGAGSTLDAPVERTGTAATETVSAGSWKPTPKAPPHSPAGYEILQILGRGGMGVVYKARQPGLKRFVALKMILAGDHADGEELVRFRIEAEAAARLQHPNIVQVYEVGGDQVHPYLSLEYVDGGSLKEKIFGKPQPPRPAAQLVQVLAEAMDYAHRQGVVHRDLKPSNIMLAAPRSGGSSRSAAHTPSSVEELYGTPKISDFGLAKRLEEDSGQTRSGTILGSPSYMAPEQALGEAKHVGPLSDQYSLGAILYELLTGRPPFQGTTVWETIELVRKQEPVPPSRLQPRVPRDLETICLKCLQKEPHKRYADAGALAEDLRRFLGNEPIMARPVSAAERLVRWARRNPYLAGSCVAIAALIVSLLVGALAYARNERHHRIQLQAQNEEIEKQKNAAVAAEGRALKNLAEEQKERWALLDAMKKMVVTVPGELAKVPGTQDLQRKVLTIAMEALPSVSGNTEAKVNLRDSALAAAHFEVGKLWRQLGETEKAAKEFREADAVYDVIAKIDPDDPDVRANLRNRMYVLMQLGTAIERLGGKKSETAACYRKAAELLAPLEQPRPGDKIPVVDIKRTRAAILDMLGRNTSDTNLDEARGYYQAALELRKELVALRNNDEARAELAGSYVLVGGADYRLRRPESTEQYYRQALDLHAALAKAHPDNPAAQREWGFARQRLGEFYLRTGRPELAAPEYNAARRVYQELVDKDAKRADFKEDLARAHYDLGMSALRQGDKVAAAKSFRASLELREALARGHDKDAALQRNLMTTLARCGDYRRAEKIADRVAKLQPDNQGALYDIACCFAVCSAAAAGDKDAQALRVRYAERAIDGLRAAVAHGHRDSVSIETDPDFDAIRDRPDFKLLAELAKPPAK